MSLPRLLPALLGLLFFADSALAAGETIRLDAGRSAALAALPVIQGSSPSETDLRSRPVVVTFFASWCPPCHAEFDHLKAAHERYGDRVTFLAVNIFELIGGFDDPDRLTRFLARKAPPFSVLGDGEAVAAAFGKVERIPTLFVFGAGGEPALHFIHHRDAEKTHVGPQELQAAIEAALAESS